MNIPNVKFLTGLVIGSALLVSTASANPLTVTQTVSLSTAPTDVNPSAAGVFQLFGSTAPGIAGDTLTGVTLELVVNETLTSLSLTDTDTSGQSQNAKFTVTANFDCGLNGSTSASPVGGTNCDTASATDGNTLDGDLANNSVSAAAQIFTTGFLSFTDGQAYNYGAPLPKTLTEDTGAVTGTTGAYTGSGSFDLYYSTFTSFNSGGSSNINVTQKEVTSATETVDRKSVV